MKSYIGIQELNGWAAAHMMREDPWSVTFVKGTGLASSEVLNKNNKINNKFNRINLQY